MLSEFTTDESEKNFCQGLIKSRLLCKNVYMQATINIESSYRNDGIKLHQKNIIMRALTSEFLRNVNMFISIHFFNEINFEAVKW